MVQLIVCVLVFLAMMASLTALVEAPMWPMAEMVYSAMFAVFQAINFFYFLVNTFSHFNFWLLLGVVSCGFSPKSKHRSSLVSLFDAYEFQGIIKLN
ncbi:unnamed protein product [Strongylus vulgaris]|uniref:MARVEL domain-containing protein n=1 Tax=Strongylus vulgaris TaxID=40348 RepID=A0A3P7LQC6_STRVU|nr:unnamed protein product [Strongylus vulgaris]